MHVALNLQRNAENSTQSFIDFYRLPFVLNDFDREVANRFQNGGQPIFAIINGVANSPSHQLWELVYTRLGYGDLSQPITEFRQAVNSVRAAVDVPGFQKFVEDLNLPVNQRAEGDDPDYDGLVNAFEYHFGTDASDTASSILPVSRILSINGFEYQGLEYLRNPNATDLAVVAQFSPSPSFSSLNESLVHSVELVDGGLEKIVVRSLVPLGNGSEFSRLTLVSNTK